VVLYIVAERERCTLEPHLCIFNLEAQNNEALALASSFVRNMQILLPLFVTAGCCCQRENKSAPGPSLMILMHKMLE
jgi:hypothetical protein